MSELPWLRSLVKHNVAAKHGSSKPLTSNKLWLLELRIIGLHTRCIMGYVQIVYCILMCVWLVCFSEYSWSFEIFIFTVLYQYLYI